MSRSRGSKVASTGEQVIRFLRDLYHRYDKWVMEVGYLLHPEWRKLDEMIAIIDKLEKNKS
jgi:hypothetical protein